MIRTPRRPRPVPALALAAVGTALTWLPAPALADCTGFKWDVSAERALFAAPPMALAAARAPDQAPAVAPGRHYALALAPEDSVRFTIPPGKKHLADGAYAGSLQFEVPTAGVYRVALSQAAWIDVVDGAHAIASDDFSGSHDCQAPRKVVVYTLPAHTPLRLQLSAAEQAQLGLTITPVAAPVPTPVAQP